MQVAETLCQHLSLLDSKNEKKQGTETEGKKKLGIEERGAEGTGGWIKKVEED